MANKLYEEANIQAIAAAIRTKGGTSNTLTVAQMADAISAISAGGGATPAAQAKDINFYDFNGTRLYSYALSELPLAALPDAPDHSGDEVPLTFQSWNYTLAQVNACTTKLDVGATYIPTDGKTHLIINIAAVGRMTVPLYINQTVANGVTINWGDGSATQTLTGTGNVNTTHTYAAIGRYDITLTVASGCTLGFGDGTSSYCVLGSTGYSGMVYCNMLQDIYVGNGVTSFCARAFYYCSSLVSVVLPNSVTSISSYAFEYCYSLASVVIPNSVTSISNYAFSYCYALASVVLPNSVTSISNNAFEYCYSLASVVLPNSVTSISSYAFEYCYSLASVVIPNSVMSINGSTFCNCYALASVVIPNSVMSISYGAFSYCYGVSIYDFSACTSVPTLANTGAFSSIPSDCKMLIPTALYNTWKAATNWSTYASKMIAV